ncbi:hypothetical protein EVAR_23732_1 [Eumeta japonica]|uniref:Uncharacterized protein n=1 Tax=Eumeta variegata TaxID=151549 RepID=A0A4C1VGD3_EUMVA|nr:hypothetical protein EVAR_23732_1 [Eumeta japonica]
MSGREAEALSPPDYPHGDRELLKTDISDGMATSGADGLIYSAKLGQYSPRLITGERSVADVSTNGLSPAFRFLSLHNFRKHLKQITNVMQVRIFNTPWSVFFGVRVHGERLPLAAGACRHIASSPFALGRHTSPLTARNRTRHDRTRPVTAVGAGRARGHWVLRTGATAAAPRCTAGYKALRRRRRCGRARGPPGK